MSAQALAVFFFVGAGARTGSGLVNFAAAIHAAAGRGRGEASASQSRGGARGAVLAFRRGRGRAFADVFFVTLGCLFWGLGVSSERSSLGWPESTRQFRLRVVVERPNFVIRPWPRVARMQSYYEKNSPRAQRSVTLIIPHANTPLGQIGPVPSSPVPSSPASVQSVQSELEYTASALILLWFLGRGGRRPTSTTRNSARGRSPRRRSAPTSSR